MMPVLANLDPLAVADSRISRRIFVRRKSAETSGQPKSPPKMFSQISAGKKSADYKFAL